MKVKDRSLVVIAKRIVIFGAGKIGRSFIGQLFGRREYEVVFVDIDKDIIEALNDRQEYKVVIKEHVTEEILVKNVRGIYGLQTDEVINEVSTAGILAVSVGKNALKNIIPVVAEGINKRFGEITGAAPLDIILAENMRSAASFVREALTRYLPADFEFTHKVGLVETSIGKMVPIMTAGDLREDPLQVFAEAYNQLILDKKGFVGDIPEVDGLAPKENIKAWVDRKAFIHNLGHATAAYYGFYKHPDYRFMYQVLDDDKVYQFTKSVMDQAAEALLKLYPDDFKYDDLEQHIDDLLTRFRNAALGDTVFRVGHDLRRKLGNDDRFMGIIKLCKELGLPYEKILKAMSFGFHFRARDESGCIFPDDARLLDEWQNNPSQLLTQLCGLSDEADRAVVHKVSHPDPLG
jgi:mannitol-1-phosphate 5-dehydrogenase